MVGIIAAVQFATSSLSGIQLALDGIWGEQSRSAFESLDTGYQIALRDAVRGFGYDPTFLDTEAKSMVADVIREVAATTGQDPNFLITVGLIESNLNPAAENGNHRGLFQMSKGAWIDAREYLSKMGIDDDATYEDDVFNVEKNALYGAAYLARARYRLQKETGRPASDAEVYLAHQQGVNGILRIMRGEDSNAATRNMLNNPPQDGGKATADPDVFLERWKLVFQRKRRDAIRQAEAWA